MKGYAVCGGSNDLSEPVDSVWSTRVGADHRCAEMNAAIADGRRKQWHVEEFELDTPGQEFN